MVLDDFKNEQAIIYKYLINSIKKNKNSHAYIIECNGYVKGLDFAMAFIKFLLCPFHNTNLEKCNGCSQCQIIDDQNFLEIKIIQADGQWIKKEQLSELQRDFTRKAVIGNQKIYLIKDAEKMNQSAANSILKFLEEPAPGIIAVLLTQNIHQLMDTIISRCQIIHLKKIINDNQFRNEKIAGLLFNSQNEIKQFLNNEADNFIEFIIDYVSYYEKNKVRSIILRNKKFLELFDDRQKVIIGLKIIILLYHDVLQYILNEKLTYFYEDEEVIINIVQKNNLYTISNKIKLLFDIVDEMKYNVNLNLLLDKLVIKMGEIDNE